MNDHRSSAGMSTSGNDDLVGMLHTGRYTGVVDAFAKDQMYSTVAADRLDNCSAERMMFWLVVQLSHSSRPLSWFVGFTSVQHSVQFEVCERRCAARMVVIGAVGSWSASDEVVSRLLARRVA